MSNDVAVRSSTEIAPLYDRSTFNVDAGDIALPKVYICQALTKSVTDELAKSGDVIVAAGPDDPDAEVVYSPKDKDDAGVLFHVLRLDRGKSYSEKNGPLQTWAFDDPAAHADAWVTYTYTVALPEIDPDMPHKFLLTKSNRGTAKRINLMLAKAVQHGNLYDVAFRLTTAPKQNEKGKWFVAVVKTDTATPDNITVAEALSDMVNTNAPASAAVAAPVDAPAI
jgi:hypothetical protein